MTGTDGISSLQTILGSLNVNESKQATKSTAAAAEQGAAVNRGDSASFSVAGGLASAGSGDSDVRLDKVAGLQAAIAGGTYNVSSSDVAGKIVDSLLK